MSEIVFVDMTGWMRGLSGDLVLRGMAQFSAPSALSRIPFRGEGNGGVHVRIHPAAVRAALDQKFREVAGHHGIDPDGDGVVVIEFHAEEETGGGRGCGEAARAFCHQHLGTGGQLWQVAGEILSPVVDLGAGEGWRFCVGHHDVLSFLVSCSDPAPDRIAGQGNKVSVTGGRRDG